MTGIVTALRYVSIAALLFIAWHHAHWSIALIVTLQLIAQEVQLVRDYREARTQGSLEDNRRIAVIHAGRDN